MTDTTARTIEERVAALEEMAAHPLTVIDTGLPAMDEAEAARFREQLGEATGQPLKVLPPRPLLTPGLARELLRECVTVVKPGEVLVVRANENWTPNQVRELQDYADIVAEYREPGVKILFMPGEEFAVMQSETA